MNTMERLPPGIQRDELLAQTDLRKIFPFLGLPYGLLLPNGRFLDDVFPMIPFRLLSDPRTYLDNDDQGFDPLHLVFPDLERGLPQLEIYPHSGSFLRTQLVDVGMKVSSRSSILEARFMLDEQDVTWMFDPAPVVGSCKPVRSGTTYRFRDFDFSMLRTGWNRLEASLWLEDGTVVTDWFEWNVIANQEGKRGRWRR